RLPEMILQPLPLSGRLRWAKHVRATAGGCRQEPGGSMSDPSTGLASTTAVSQPMGVSTEGLLPQLVQHLRQNRTALREEWAQRITEAQLLTAMTPEEIFSEATAVYDNYVE